MKNKIFIFMYIIFFIIVKSFQEKEIITADEVKDLEITKKTNSILEAFANRILQMYSNIRNDKSTQTTAYNNNSSSDASTEIIERSGYYDGDIILNEYQAEEVIDQIAEKITDQGIDISDIYSGSSSRKKRKIDKNVKYNWTFPIFYYVDTNVNESQVDKALKLMENETCIRFEKKNSSVPRKPGLRYFLGNGCYSHIGRTQLFKFQDVSIGKGCDTIGTIQHETMHALGSYHEQSRADRDKYIIINMTNVLNGSQHNFFPINFSSSITYNISYDYGSTMQYRTNAFSKNNGSTMLPKKKFYQKTLGVDAGITFLDAKLLNKHYCRNKCNNSISCLNSGYQDPNNCEKCKCIDGYVGPTCAEFPTDKPGCGKTVRNVTRAKLYFYSGGNRDCIYHIQSTLNQTLKIFIETLTYYPAYNETCTLQNSLEVKYLRNKAKTGALFCLSEKNVTILSRTPHVIIHHRSTRSGNSVNLEIEPIENSNVKALESN